MKLLMPFLLALFPFLHDQKYEITIDSCEADAIIASYEGKPFTLSLFNIQILDEKGWQKTCEILTKAEKVEIEMDSTVSISEPLSAYVFADGSLVQEELLREEHAVSKIHNPEYTYEKKLMEIEKSQTTMSTNLQEEKKSTHAASGWKFLLCLFLTWSCMALYLFIKIKKISLFHTRQNH